MGVHIERVILNVADPTKIASTERWIENRFGRIRDVVPGPDGLYSPDAKALNIPNTQVTYMVKVRVSAFLSTVK